MTPSQPGRFSPEDIAAQLQGLPVEEKVARLKNYLQDLRKQRQQIGKRLDFFQAGGTQGETVFYGPDIRPGSAVAGSSKNVLVIDEQGRVFNMTLVGLKPVDLQRPLPLVEIDLNAGAADLLVE